MKKVVVFDFDGTLTEKDSFVSFIKYVKGERFFYFNLGFIVIFWFLAKFKLMSTGSAKQMVFRKFFKGMSLTDFNKFSVGFQDTINSILKQETKKTINYYLSRSYDVLIISASIENWILPWANSNHIKTVLSTKIEIDNDGNLTGNFSSANCRGEEKLRRLLSVYPNLKKEQVIVYGDSSGDKSLMDFAAKSYYRTLKY